MTYEEEEEEEEKVSREVEKGFSSSYLAEYGRWGFCATLLGVSVHTWRNVDSSVWFLTRGTNVSQD